MRAGLEHDDAYGSRNKHRREQRATSATLYLSQGQRRRESCSSRECIFIIYGMRLR